MMPAISVPLKAMVNWRTVLLCASTLLLLPFHSVGVTHAADGDKTPPQDVGSYLAAGDVMSIAVWGEEKMSGDFPVEPPGTLYYPAFGSIDVSRMKAQDLADYLTARLKKLLKHPYVTVLYKQHRATMRVAVWGEVAKPGVVELPIRSTVFELVLQAGPLPTASSTVRWIRSGTPPRIQEVNIQQVLTTGDWQSQQMGRLQEGDLVIIPRADSTTWVTFLGQVQKPGSYPFQEGLRLLTALTVVGGLQAGNQPTGVGQPFATREPDEARILRVGKPNVTVNLQRLLRDGDLSLNCALQPGDVVIIGASNIRVTVLGQVKNPGSYPLPANGTILDALAQAGSVTEKGDLMHAQVTHGGKHQVVNLWKLLWEGDATANVALSDDDVVLIPPLSRIYVLGAVQKPGEVAPEPDLSLSMALDRSGGALDGADLGHVRVIRQSGAQSVDLVKLVRDGDMAADVRLEPGDTIFVPMKASVYVMGAVVRPGPYSITEKSTMMDLLRAGAAPMLEAQLQKVVIMRTVEGRLHPLEVNLDRLIKKGDMSQNVLLKSGDLIIIPGPQNKKQGYDVWQYTSLFGNLSWTLRTLLGR